ncbi:MAG: delta-aminolevulinic acid dehydratase [candidate division WOR-3 bacterium]|nr:MAG: delta-aminolevulinic acid dehydratase [candidate division WOR-3 bacterium]
MLSKLERSFTSNGFAGWDPYDGLNSRFLKVLTLNRKWLRIAVTQSMKRSPVNLRPLLGIPRGRNPKAIGLLAGAYLRRYKKTKQQTLLDNTRHLLDWLVENTSPGYSGYAWGYNFDWQSSVFYIPKGVPTVVNTTFIANAFLDAYFTFKESNYLDVARSACDFILNDLNRTSTDSDSDSKKYFWFSYSPVDETCCHNANLLAAELLARIYSFSKNNILYESAMKSTEFTLSRQNSDGSWCYGLSPQQKFVDSFHTGFVLVSLVNIMANLDHTDNKRFERILLKGYEFYKKTFWESDGCPRYYRDKRYPIDLHCSAQGIITFLHFREYDNEAVDFAQKIAEWAINNMWDAKKNYFYFQRTKHYTNKIPYLRWPNVWMYYALTTLDSMT